MQGNEIVVLKSIFLDKNLTFRVLFNHPNLRAISFAIGWKLKMRE
jgi:hypothetical protein